MIRVDFYHLQRAPLEQVLPKLCEKAYDSKKDGFAEEQPIFISANEDNANNASLLILADGAMPDTETLKQYERILNIFDGNDETALNNARAYWKQIKALDGELHYWQQNDRGVFEQKA